MKILILLVIISTVSLALPSPKESQEQWMSFKNNFNKNYETEQENIERMNIFKNNLDKIEAHNKLYDAGEVTYKMGINQFSDWTSEEFMSYVNRYKITNFTLENAVVYKAPLDFTGPASINWVEKGAVGSVKDQGGCGSCWAFSTTGVLEGQYQITHGQMISLSEQNLVDCSREYGNNGCEGGLQTYSYTYVHDHGINSEDKYPYEGVDASCRFDEGTSILKVVSVIMIASGSEATLEAVVAEKGPVAVGIYATENLQHYSSGVFYDSTCPSDSLNHGVLVAGFDRQDDQDYWLVKNSWGDGWGEGGYVKMSRKRDNNCAIATLASIPTL